MDETAAAHVARRVQEWVEDPESDVEYAEEVEGRWAVRMRQTVRDATTTWIWIGDRSVVMEAYLLPPPPHELEVYRQALIRNGRSFRVHFALDGEGALILRARLPVERVSDAELDYVLAEIYEAVEVSFRTLLQAGFDREKMA
ncbi:MAG TPA: YbjN domain-containing protein [Acidimicrobiia bacterium]|nr:YbjN domain-containing protein [Acidimicrobiia bacterium]